MNKLSVTVLIIAVFFCFAPVFAAGPETPATRKIIEDLKEDRRRADEAISQNGQELKEFLEQAKEAESAAEGSVKNTTKEKSASPGKTKAAPSAVSKEVKLVPLGSVESGTPGEVKTPSVNPEAVTVLSASGVEGSKVVSLRPGELETSSVSPGKVKAVPGRPEGAAWPRGIKMPPVYLEKLKVSPAPVEQNIFIKTISSAPVQRGLYFLIVVCFGVMCCYRIIVYRKKVAAKKKSALLDASLLAAVDQWRFTEGDFKRYQDKLAPLVDTGLLDINSPEFKKHFIKDLAVTEILFQAALNEDMQADPALAELLGRHKFYLAGLDKKGSAFSNALDNYRRSLTLTAGQQVPYAEYYKDFLNLLMIIKQQDDAAVLELYQRYLLVSKLAGKAGGGSSDAAEIQEGLDSAINKFKSEYDVIIKEEGIEPLNKEQITG